MKRLLGMQLNRDRCGPWSVAWFAMMAYCGRKALEPAGAR
jgi:hypothetical protein